MANLNKVMLIGNLTRDIELKYTPGGLAVAELGLAINRKSKNPQTGELKEETTFVDVTMWGRQAEIAKEYLTKGKPVYIEGRLTLDSWDDKQTGQKRSKLKVTGEALQLLGARGDAGGGGGGGASYEDYDQRPPARQQSSGGGNYGGGGGGGGGYSGGGQQQKPKPKPAPAPMQDEDDDIPF